MSIFKSISRATMIGRLAASSCVPAIRRRLSIQHYVDFRLRRESGLYDKRLQAYDAEVEDALEISDDGMIYPGITNADMAFLNGALFMPNTHFMRELSRMSYDYHMDAAQGGQHSTDLHYLCIPQGKTPDIR
ncbi:hypothetical protein PAAG_06760 [Paracoccidioides lutzii Pb01]|uniref:Tse2 ADP-ribosyltransferase toxin domain-containing protein n=1 Tax=Paracoccidioides lutzii (strain ATCC MYA-826 / Pb01) TaxID=502779 RepID=C1H7L9_PARBA|nr:hypothetical protein PAAG_06760 [Paracoccidioides lutzii Pb01]EEH36342.2 hypothetical protein PAAG_06760 [Paracoccidioides lutzii Pb01]